MQALSNELEQSLQNIFFLGSQDPASSPSSRNPTIVSASDGSSSSKNRRDVGRAIRCLERNLAKIEDFWFQQQRREGGHLSVDQECLQHHTAPLLIAVLRDLDINPLVASFQEWMYQDIFQLFGQACVAASRILTLVDLNDEQVESLVDCAATEMSTQENNPPYSPFLISLLELLNQYLQHRPILPSISSEESLRLVSFLTSKCLNDLNTPYGAEAGCTAMRSFLVHMLQHVATIKSQEVSKSAHEWWIGQLVGNGSSTDDIICEASLSLRQLETFGKEFLEFLRDSIILHRFEEEIESSTILLQMNTAVNLVDILQIDLDLGIQVFEKQCRCLFVEFTNAAVQHENPKTLDILLRLGKKVLIHNKVDSATQRASALLLYKYLLLGNRNGVMQDVNFLVEACSKFSTDPWIQSGILTCVLLPTDANSKQLVAQMVQNVDPSSPWSVLLASKLPHNEQPVDIEDRILSAFVSRHRKSADTGSP